MSVPPGTLETQKRCAAQAAVAEIRDGMVVGLGTGSTAASAVEAIGGLVRNGVKIQAVVTSEATRIHAERLDIPLVPLDGIAEIDLCIDGVDEIDPEFRAIKGAGGAMLREKIVARAARRMIAIADSTKAAAILGGRPVPAEVLPAALSFVARQLSLLGCDPILRHTPDGFLARTDQGNVILDCRLGPLPPKQFAAAMDGIPGLLGHGLFLSEIDALYLGTEAGAVLTDRADPDI